MVNMTAAPGSCLNCGAPLTGRFCAACGQRVIPAYPSMRELIGDAWQELTGWDGRFFRTARALLARPGALTREVLEGRRARYISPVRLYLVASVFFFIVGAAAPNLRIQDRSTGEVRELKIGLWTPNDNAVEMSPEDRAEAARQLAEAPWWVKPLIESVLFEPEAFQQRMLSTMPKVLFALVPAFAGILALFYWRRPYSQHLIFSLHLHTVIFFAIAVAELPKFTGNVPLSAAIGLAAILFIAQYGLRGMRRVYRSGWAPTALKAAGIGIVYVLVSVPALLLAMAWAAFVR